MLGWVDMATAVERTLGDRCCVLPGDRRLAPAQAARLARDLQLLSDPVRLQILDLLASRPGEVCVCDLVANLPVRQPTISHHLRLLRRAGLVTVQRRGLWAHYTVVRPALDERRRRLREYLENLTTTRPVSRARRAS
jgi:ArsR family transcriptional regulator